MLKLSRLLCCFKKNLIRKFSHFQYVLSLSVLFLRSRDMPALTLRKAWDVFKLSWNGVVGKQWAPNCYHLCANIHRITRPLVIERAPFLRSSAGPHDVHWAVTQPLTSPVKRCMIAVMVPPTRSWPNLTRMWKLNNYCPILRPSYSKSYSSTSLLCYFLSERPNCF